MEVSSSACLQEGGWAPTRPHRRVLLDSRLMMSVGDGLDTQIFLVVQGILLDDSDVIGAQRSLILDLRENAYGFEDELS